MHINNLGWFVWIVSWNLKTIRNFLIYIDITRKGRHDYQREDLGGIDSSSTRSLQEIIKAEKLVDDWLGFGIPLGTRLGRAMNSFNIKGIEGIETG